MTQYLSNLGPHFIIDGAAPQDLPKAIEHVKNTHPEFVTVMGSEKRWTQAHDFGLSLLHDESLKPNPRVILRYWPDDGNWLKPEFRDPAAWYDRFHPFVQEGFLMLCSNEDMQDNVSDYSLWLSHIVEYAGRDGGGVAVNSYSTGNPHENQYNDEEMLPIAEALHIWHDYSIDNRHEYFALSDQQTSGNLGRYQRFWDLCIKNKLLTPITVIGEFGLLVNMDPHLGWREAKISGENYFARCKTHNEAWYYPRGVHLQLFCYFPWASSPSVAVDNAFIGEFEKKIQQQPWTISSTPTIKQKRSLPGYPVPEPIPPVNPPEPELVPDIVKEINLDLTKLKEALEFNRVPDEIKIQLIYHEENK